MSQAPCGWRLPYWTVDGVHRGPVHHCRGFSQTSCLGVLDSTLWHISASHPLHRPTPSSQLCSLPLLPWEQRPSCSQRCGLPCLPALQWQLLPPLCSLDTMYASWTSLNANPLSSGGPRGLEGARLGFAFPGYGHTQCLTRYRNKYVCIERVGEGGWPRLHSEEGEGQFGTWRPGEKRTLTGEWGASWTQAQWWEIAGQLCS